MLIDFPFQRTEEKERERRAERRDREQKKVGAPGFEPENRRHSKMPASAPQSGP
jgi:hypothetical protein